MATKLIRFDWAMKKLLRNKANFDILEGFLSELLREDIQFTKFWKAKVIGNEQKIKVIV